VAGQFIGSGPLLGIHCAADVSWRKSAAELYAPNVLASLNFCEALRQSNRSARIIYVSTAFTRRDATDFKNGYEETKALAEREVFTHYSDLMPTTFSCSLVTGAGNDGAISRFHGIYPLLKVLSIYNPPAVIGDPRKALDIVPLDWVADELATHARALTAGFGYSDEVVATAGPAAAPFKEVLGLAENEIEAFRRSRGLAFVRPTSIVSRRQFAFLNRAVKTWDTPGSMTRGMRIWSRLQLLLDGYANYLESSQVRPPKNVTRPAPLAVSFMPVVMRYWLNRFGREIESGARRYISALDDREPNSKALGVDTFPGDPEDAR
jgi:hypothetical protein